METKNIYKGDLQNFVKIIEPFTRQIVLRLSKHKKKKTTCSNKECKNRTRLQAAHKIGYENRKIIATILQKFLVEDKPNQIDISVTDFIKMYVKAHTPLDKVVSILCPSCHVEYGKKQRAENVDFTHLIEFDDYPEDGKLILKEVKLLHEDEKFLKSELIKKVNKEHHLNLINSNVSFSKLNKTFPVYWLEPKKEKLKNKEHYFLLFNQTNKKYYVSKQNCNEFTQDQLKKFKEKDKDMYKFEIITDGNKFKDRFSNFEFKIDYKGTIS